MASPVLLIGSMPPPSGGIASHIDDLRRCLAEERRTVRVVEPPRRAAPGSLLRLAGTLAEAAWRGGWVHLHTNGHNVGSWRIARLVACASRSDRTLLTLHSGLAPAFIATHPRLCSSIAGRYRWVICVSPPLERALVEAGVDAARLIMAPAFSADALPLPIAPAGLLAIRRRHHPLIAAVLAHGPEYGATVLTEGFARVAATLPDAGLVLLGPAARALDLQARIERLRLGLRIYRFGDLDRHEALGVIATCDLFVRPTLVDGDALSVREALALGRRVVASDAARRPTGTRCFPAGSATGLAAAILDVLAAETPIPLADTEPPPLSRVLALYGDSSGGA